MSVELILGDCLQVMKGMEAGSVDLTVTSPPYDNLRSYNGNSVFDFEGIAKELYRVTKQGGVVVWVVGDATVKGAKSCTSYRQLMYFVTIGYLLYEDMIYKKNTSGYPSPHLHYENVTEKMLVLSKNKPKTVNLLKDKKNRWAGTSNFGIHTNRKADGTLKERGKSIVAQFGIRQNIWEYATGKGYSSSDDIAYGHPAIFPEALARDHILSWSNEGDTIFDCFMGSGTTGKMAVKYGRNFIGCEIDEGYYRIAEKRIAEAQLQMRMVI